MKSSSGYIKWTLPTIHIVSLITTPYKDSYNLIIFISGNLDPIQDIFKMSKIFLILSCKFARNVLPEIQIYN